MINFKISIHLLIIGKKCQLCYNSFCFRRSILWRLYFLFSVQENHVVWCEIASFGKKTFECRCLKIHRLQKNGCLCALIPGHGFWVKTKPRKMPCTDCWVEEPTCSCHRTHLFPIHLSPNSTGQPRWCIRESIELSVLLKKKESQLSPSPPNLRCQ